MHAHFTRLHEANALKQRALPADVRFDVNPATERRITLDGTWKFLFSKNNDLCPKDFHKPGFSTRQMGKLKFRGSWELQASMHLSIQIPVIRSPQSALRCLPTTIP